MNCKPGCCGGPWVPGGRVGGTLTPTLNPVKWDISGRTTEGRTLPIQEPNKQPVLSDWGVGGTNPGLGGSQDSVDSPGQSAALLRTSPAMTPPWPASGEGTTGTQQPGLGWNPHRRLRPSGEGFQDPSKEGGLPPRGGGTVPIFCGHRIASGSQARPQEPPVQTQMCQVWPCVSPSSGTPAIPKGRWWQKPHKAEASLKGGEGKDGPLHSRKTSPPAESYSSLSQLNTGPPCDPAVPPCGHLPKTENRCQGR